MKKYFEKIKYCFKNNRVRWRQHALSRMLERGISRKDVQTAVTEGKEIEYYHESKPYPGCLMLGFSRKVPIHVVVSIDLEESIAYVVTSYVPDTNYFEEDLKTRKKREVKDGT